jgi:hypothetical protein
MRGPKMNEKTVQRFIAEGRGTGQGADYKPWISVQDISSLGESRRVPGLKIDREHQLLSNVEWHLFLLLEWSTDIVDIREQFPLDRDLTQEIAATLGIRHPFYPGTNVPTVMTVDMLVTRMHGGKEALEAYDAKRSEEAEDENSLAKLEITRYYLENSGIPHHLVFHSALPQPEVTNIELIRGSALKPEEQEPYPGFYEHHKHVMASMLERQQATGSLYQFCTFYDRSQSISAGEGLRIAKMLMLDRILDADLTNPDLVTAPMASFRIAKRKGGLKIVGGR